MTKTNENTKLNVALVAYNSLGDGLIHAMIAENLSKQGFNVTYFCLGSPGNVISAN